MSVIDFATYAQFHLSNTPNLLKPSTFALLHERASEDYAMGWIVNERAWAKGEVLWHLGSNTLFQAMILVAPQVGFAVVGLCNSGSEAALDTCMQVMSEAIRHYFPENAKD